MKRIFFAFLFVIGFCSISFADSVTLTTYYPAPFGMYQEMRVMGKLGVGTTNPTSSMTVDDGTGAYSATGTQPLGLFMTATNQKPALSLVSTNAAGVVTPNAGNVALYAHGSDYDGYFLGSKTYFGGSVGIGTTSPSYSLEVGNTDPTKEPASTNGIAVAIKNDLWVDGNIYSDGGGEWTRNSASGWLYPTTITDLVGIGTDTPYAPLHVRSSGNYASVFEQTTNGASNYAIMAFQGNDAASPATKGGVYINAANDAYGIYQANGGKNYFESDIGIGSASPRCALDINPTLSGTPQQKLVQNLLSVGQAPNISNSATAKIFGTMLVSGGVAFGGKVKAGMSLQIGSAANAQPTCNATNLGMMEYRCYNRADDGCAMAAHKTCGVDVCVSNNPDGSNYSWVNLGHGPCYIGSGGVSINTDPPPPPD